LSEDPAGSGLLPNSPSHSQSLGCSPYELSSNVEAREGGIPSGHCSFRGGYPSGRGLGRDWV
jgi:hypothetical protein